MSRLMRYTATSGLLAAVSLATLPAFAENPIIRHVYTADPAPMVHGDTVYLCTSHDEDVTVENFFTMNDWFVFSSKDMVNWTDHGSPLSYQTFSWSNGKAWAPHCVERAGKFYFYVPVSPNAIGVAVADSPTGPFTDPIGAPLVSGSHQYIDPTVFVDTDGQAYLYFGNPKLWYVKLNENMISYTGGIIEIPQTTQSFGVRVGNDERPTLYEEGPWFYKRGDLYYMLYAATGIPEDIGYSTSPGPTGPWTYRGIIMPNQAGHAFTNHAGVVDFQGRSFFFYHTQEAPGGGGFKRSVAVEEFTYNSDGSFPTINKTSSGVTESVQPLIPYYRVEGETMAYGAGIEIEDSNEGGRNLSNLENGDYIKLASVDFLTGPISFEASVASAASGGNIEIRVDAVDGTLIGTCPVGATGGWQSWEIVSCDVSDVTDVHDLFLVFTGPSGFLFNIDFWQFTPKDPLPTGTGGNDGAGGSPAGTGGESVSGAGGMTAGGGSGGTPTQSSGGIADNTDDPPDSAAQDEAGCTCTTAPRSGRDRWIWLALGTALIGLRSRRTARTALIRSPR